MKASRDKDISYEVVRSRRSTADIVVERNGKIVVRAPAKFPDERIEDIVESKRHWVYKTLAEWRDLNATRVLREYRNGEGFLYLGRAYRLRLVSKQKGLVALRDGRFCMVRDLVDRGDIDAAQSAFRDYYIRLSQQRLAQRIKYYAPKVGVKPLSDVRELGFRWASCSSKGRLAFHWKCMMALPKIIDYVIVHELCHMHQSDHTDAFWSEIDKVMPDYDERKEWLRKNGAGLDI
jgi:predicted metal-dependent hydrolase